MHKKLIAGWIGGGVALAAVTTFTLDQLHSRTFSETLAAERAAARRAGIPVFMRDLAKPMPPANQNAAVIYEGMPAYNSEERQNKAEDELHLRLVTSPTTLSAADWQTVQKTVAEAGPRLRALHEALSRPTCVFHHDYQTAHPENILLPELAKLRKCARLLSMESLLMAHEGKSVAAVANTRLGFRLADHAGTDPVLIGYLVAVAIDNITTGTMQNVLLLNPKSAATANAVLASLKDVPLRSIKPALSGESAFEQTICETLRHEGAAGIQKFSSENDVHTSELMLKLLSAGILLRRSYWNRAIDKNAVNMLRFSRTTMAVCDQPYRESQPVLARAEATGVLSSHNMENFLAAILLPVETGLVSKRAFTANKFAVTQAAAAVLSYRAAHDGALPATLDKAMPAAPPTNAFDGTPLAYQIVGDGFTVGALNPTDPTSKSMNAAFTLPTTRQ